MLLTHVDMASRRNNEIQLKVVIVIYYLSAVGSINVMSLYTFDPYIVCYIISRMMHDNFHYETNEGISLNNSY